MKESHMQSHLSLLEKGKWSKILPVGRPRHETNGKWALKYYFRRQKAGRFHRNNEHFGPIWPSQTTVIKFCQTLKTSNSMLLHGRHSLSIRLGVLLSVKNSTQTTGIYWSYTLLLKPPALMCFAPCFIDKSKLRHTLFTSIHDKQSRKPHQATQS